MTNPNERNSEQGQLKRDTTNQSQKDSTQERGQKPPKQEDDSTKKSPMHESGQPQPKQQDPSKKDPSQADDSRRRDREAAEQVEKRRA